MCNRQYNNMLIGAISVIAGIIFTILSFFNFLTTGLLVPILGISSGAFSVILLTICAASLLRQNNPINRCLYRQGVRVLIPAMWLMAVAGFTLTFALTNVIIGLVLIFLIFGLLTYNHLALYCFLKCMSQAGCAENAG